MVGAPVSRKEDSRLLTGRGRFVEDIAPPRTAYMAFVRSTEPHARITAIDTGPARERPGVLGVWTAADFGDLPPLPSLEVPGVPARPPLARDVVRFAGEPVAVVAATDRGAAADAVAGVAVEYEPLPAVASIDAALAEDAPLVFPELGGNVVLDNPPSPDDALAAAPRRTSLRLVNQRCAAAPIEPVACLADWDADKLTLYATCQMPHQVKNGLAEAFGLAQHQVRVVAPDVGGSFGPKGSRYPEYLLAPLLSRELGRPVRCVQTRSEDLVATTQGRGQVHDVEVGFDDDGRMLALRLAVTQDCGGWPDPAMGFIPALTTMMAAGCYRIPAVAAGFRVVATNTTPTASYRGAGRPEASYTIERVIDLVARETGVDPVEVRRRNFIPADAFPYPAPTGLYYDSGDYAAGLDLLLDRLDYPALRAEQAARREDPDRPLMGIGLATYVELGGVGPSAYMRVDVLGGWESARVRMQPDGSVVVHTGTSPQGQGHETMFGQLVADVLGVPTESVTVAHGDTDTVQEGIGTFGSRSTAVGGSAAHEAATQVGEQLRRVAAHLLEADPGDIDLAEGRLSVRGSPEHAVSVAEAAMAAHRPGDLPADIPAGLEAVHYFEPPNYTFPSGAHCCVVGVDRRTGQVNVERYLAVDDCGTVVNPMLADGQIMGGVAQGIAQALLEEVRHDEAARPRTTTLVDYLVPGVSDLPSYELDRTVTPTPVNPLGAKGIGESGATGAPPAVVNAVVDALARAFPEREIRHLDMPLTSEKVWAAMRGGSS
jgi:carbon-monoxide dehydrogenase large subunit